MTIAVKEITANKKWQQGGSFCQTLADGNVASCH
jgi:hypothetical protein